MMYLLQFGSLLWEIPPKKIGGLMYDEVFIIGFLHVFYKTNQCFRKQNKHQKLIPLRSQAILQVSTMFLFDTEVRGSNGIHARNKEA